MNNGRMTWRFYAIPQAVLTACCVALAGPLAGFQGTPAGPPQSRFVDPFAARPRVVVMTDIANEPDDQMSLVRFLVYSNQFDVEGLVATTSTWMKTGPGPTSSSPSSTPTRRCSRTC